MLDYNRMHDERKSYSPAYTEKKATDVIKESVQQLGGSVLDFGSGSNGSFDHKRIAIEYYSFDIDRQNSADYHSLKEIKRNFTTIVFSDVLEHMNRKQIDKSLAWATNHCENIVLKIPLINPLNLGEILCDSTHDITSFSLLQSKDLLWRIENKLGMKITMYAYSTPISTNPLKLVIQKIIAWACNCPRHSDIIIIATNKRIMR